MVVIVVVSEGPDEPIAQTRLAHSQTALLFLGARQANHRYVEALLVAGLGLASHFQSPK